MKKTFYQGDEYLDFQKKEADDKFLNKKVEKKFKSLGPYAFVLDLGCGTGAQIRRNIELNVLKNNAKIIGIDINADAIKRSIYSFKRWAKEKNCRFYDVKILKSFISFNVNCFGKKYFVELRKGNVYDLKKYCGKVDAVTALSLFEHTDMDKSLKSVYGTLKNKGVLYSLINYSVKTKFSPTPRNLKKIENCLMSLFNYVAIDKQFLGGVETGNSKCGILLPKLLKKIGFRIIKYGDSSWKVGGMKLNTKNSKIMLEHFLSSFYNLFKSANLKIKKKFKVNDEEIDFWYNLRKKQLIQNKLRFFCINKDVVCVKEKLK